MFETIFHWGREKLRWERLLSFFGLTAALAVLSSCGASTTTVAPTITVSCNPTDVTVLGTSQCTSTINNNNTGSTLVNWSVSGTSNGSINTTSGLYSAPAAVPTNNVVTITATSQAQSTLTATASLTIVAATAITAVICNDSAGNQASIVSSMNTLACTAYSSVATGTTVPVNWSVTNAKNPAVTTNIGSISAQGIYTAALVPPPGQTITITATSKALATETMSVTATVVFGNAVLSGPYVFSTSGRLTNSSNAFWARAGSFTAGGGTLTGIEDTNQGGTPNTVTTQRNFTGSYSIGADGRGTLQFCEDTSSACPLGSSSATVFFRIVVISPQQAEIIEDSVPPASSASRTAGGEILSQDPLLTPNSENLSGTYSFNFSGVSSGATEESAVGEFASNGFGTIGAGSSVAPGEMEINSGGPVPFASTTLYSINSNGRGTATLGGLTFSFYPISAGRAKFIEIDPVPPLTTTSSILVGDAFRQQMSSPCSWGLNELTGPAVFETTGMDSRVIPAGAVIGDLGSFTASNGAISTASIDENSGGTVSAQVGTPSDNYTLDACGRGTLAIGVHTYVFYMIKASDAVLQETTSGVIAHGTLVASGGPFTNSSLSGSYAFRLAGTDAPGSTTTGNREDFLGQFTSDGKDNVTGGSLDINSIGATQSAVVINLTAQPNQAGILRGTMTLSTNPVIPAQNFVLYLLSPTQFYILDTDTTGTAIGTIYNQF